MFIAVEPDEHTRHRHLLEQMYRTRKAVFHGKLVWDVRIDGEFEIDEFDSRAAYIIWCDDDAKTFIGCMRLLPTTGPTLLDAVFRATYPADLDLSSPSIWEATRTCINDVALSYLYPGLSPSAGFGLIMLAVCEWCLDHNIETIVTNYEPSLARIYRRSGVNIEEIGRCDGYGRLPVCCGLVNISEELLFIMRKILNATNSLANFAQGKGLAA